MPPDPSFAPTQLAARAAYLLRGNDLGVMTTAAPLLYPHMWSWDAAFVSIGLAPLSVERAVVELDTLLSAQWRNGMIPHIVFANGVDGYFPGPARWATSALAINAPRNRHTSGITQPPVHAIAVQRILDHARTRGRSTRAVAESFLDRRWDDLVHWHRWLADARDPKSHGRVTLYHGWESGMDNSPRWDSAYANVVPGIVPEYQREDNAIVTDATQRPSDVEYDRYLWLLEEMKSARYDDELLPKVMSFAVEDVFVSAILSVACTVLAEIGEDYKRPNADVRDLYSWAERFRAGVVETTDERTGAARDYDVRADRWVATETVAQFAPLLCGGLPHDRERSLLRLLDGPAVLRAPGPEVLVDPVDVARVAGLPRAGVLARARLAGDDVVVLLVLRPTRVVRALADAAARGAAPGQRRHLRRVLRAVHRRAVGQHAAVVDGRRGPRLAGLIDPGHSRPRTRLW